jgi:hypothetical protein
MHRAIPEVNRICSKARHDRAYKRHINALRNIKPSIDMKMPKVPNTIGKNMKRYELEKKRNLEIQNQNIRLVNRLDRILRQENYTAPPPQKPYTLQGRFQKERMLRISEENKKIVRAVQNSRPILNRNEWLNHKIEHQYQVHKNAMYKQTLPMAEIIRLEEEEIKSARKQKYLENDELYEVQPPQQPNTSRTGGYRKHQTPAPQEKLYKVHEPTNQSTSISQHVNDTIEEGYEDQQDGQPYDEQPGLSLRKVIHEQIEEGYEDQKDGQPYDEQPGLSLRKEIDEQIEEGYKDQQDGQPYDKSNQPICQIFHKKLQGSQNDEQPQQQGGLSISQHVNNQVQEGLEEKRENEAANQKQSGRLNIKGRVSNALTK